MRTKVAIACQGGGSQTAFTAGVLKALTENGLTDKFELVGLSGTSGGALCATLIWYAIRKNETPIWRRLIEFWQDNTAEIWSERMVNDAIIDWMRQVNAGTLASFQTSPGMPLIQAMIHLMMRTYRQEFVDLKALLRNHIDFDEIASWGPQPTGPVLVIGAASVLSGRLRKFISTKETIKIEHLLASSAVPNLFPAVEVDGDALWDGLFSDNPPIDDLVRKGIVGEGNVPHELWVIKINPTKRSKIPVLPGEIADRRHQLEGNISLFQNLKLVEMLNDLILGDAFRPGFHAYYEYTQPVLMPKPFAEGPDKPYYIPWIEMSDEMQQALDYEGKFDRSPENINRLIAHGEERCRVFLEERERRLAAVPRSMA
ncbi:MAG: patatin-like phospholipase family protein [Acidocella sp.]|uniref:patatin-like phospholipase family protein n=1 Tax=Acidocella sp. TaxID=50710 RepID=UPI003FD8DEE8